MKDSTKRNRYQGKKARQESMAKARLAKAEKARAQADVAPTEPQTPSTSLVDDIPTRLSASKRKLSLFTDDIEPICDQQQQPQYAMVDLRVFSALMSHVPCSSCGQKLSFTSSSQKGFAMRFDIICPACAEDCEDDNPIAWAMTSPTLVDSAHFDINRRMVTAFLNMGLGFAGLASFCETLGIPVMQEKTFSSHVTAIATKCSDFTDQALDSAVEKVRSHHGVADDTVLDVAVSFDGSWHKRGHTSKHGFASVVEVDTGLVVDYHVMTTYCHVCQTVGAQRKKDGDTVHEEWYALHKAECRVNHQGSSGLMEVEAARVMWSRSLERRLRYTTMVSDGDSKTFTELERMQPYNIPVEKEECTNHVAKRLGTALRNLCTNESKRKNTLGGRKPGSLTQIKITLLQDYYKKAVSSKCSSVEELRKKILASLDHATSTDDQPNHNNCPEGQKSWCFYNRAMSHGASPPSHRGKSSIELSPHVASFVRPVYERLTADALLGRCLKGLTQNTNECLHSVIWNRCPKHIFVGRSRIEIAAALGVGQFNSGSASFRDFMRTVGLVVSAQTFSQGQKRDIRRITAAERKESTEAKRRRKVRLLASSTAEQEFLRTEGGKAYSAGAY